MIEAVIFTHTHRDSYEFLKIIKQTSNMHHSFHFSATLTFILFIAFPLNVSSTLLQDLQNLKPPSDFNSTIANNCLTNPSLRYCNSSPEHLNDIFKSTIVASHLCNESQNPNCIESFPKIDLKSRVNVASLYLSFHFFWKYCPLTVLAIDLSNNSLKGNFPLEVLQCTQIQLLDLNHNLLTGELPIESFKTLPNLTVLNVSYNHFTESKISDAYFFNRFSPSCFIQSGLLPSHKHYAIKAAILLIGFPISVTLLVCLFGWLCCFRPDYLPRMFQRKYKFTPSMIKSITNGFSSQNLVARRDGVELYRGSLRNGVLVRIEIYKHKFLRKFVEECKVLVQLRHKNIAEILGWCDNQRLRAIVTKWTGDTIEMWVSNTTPAWTQRLRVVMGVVDGMCYLHKQWPQVGYDLRTNSLLLSYDLEPLISRFKVGHQNSYSKNIYKLGVLLLELITNRRPKEFDVEETGFIQHIRSHYPGNLKQVIDATMNLSDDMMNQAEKGISLGLMCIDQSSSKQPSLSRIFNIVSKAYESARALPSQHQAQECRRHKQNLST